MPLSQQLTLDADPGAVPTARRWVAGLLVDLGRPELAESAELGVSELVTNALLHAAPPIRVRLRGTRAHPRIEVFDHSPVLPLGDASPEPFDEDDLFTGGRGLDLVALFSRAWGSITDSEGKVVWFEPADGEEGAGPVEGEHVTLDEADEGADTERDRLRVRLLGMPVQEWAAFRLVYAELRRELRLLALTHPEDYPLASELIELSRRIEGHRARARGIDDLEAAIADGRESVDLEYDVPASAPAAMARMSELLEQAAAFCTREHMLASAPTAEQLRLQAWYARQFTLAGTGAPPERWESRQPAQPA